jgi:hypothetical protein
MMAVPDEAGVYRANVQDDETIRPSLKVSAGRPPVGPGARRPLEPARLERIPTKWMPVRRKNARQNKMLEPYPT